MVNLVVAGAADPMAQFAIKRIIPLELFGYDISFTNSSLFMVLALVLISAYLIAAMNSRALVPGRLQSTAESTYEFVAGIVRENLGEDGKKFFPWVFTIFIFILTLNMLGMIPGSFTVTSHIIVTFALAAMVWVVATIVGFVRHGTHYLKLFVPDGVPIWLMPLIVPIEIVSYLIRPISLSVRLFANMMAGHTMLKVFAGFAVSLPFVAKALPVIFTAAFTGLEFLVSFLQAFIFTVLTCIYLNDAVHMHDH